MAVIDHAHQFYCVGDECECEHCEQRAKSHALIKSVLAQREAQDRDRLQTCVHEAGHVAMGWRLFGADAVLSACVKSSGAGQTVYAIRPKADYATLAASYAAGVAAEMKFLGRLPDVCANDHYLGDLAEFADIRKHWRKPGSVTRAFAEAAIAVKEEVFDREPETWGKVMGVARALFESPDGRVVFLPELASQLEQDRRVRKYMRTRRRKRIRDQGESVTKSFQRLMQSTDEFWKESGAL